MRFGVRAVIKRWKERQFPDAEGITRVSEGRLRLAARGASSRTTGTPPQRMPNSLASHQHKRRGSVSSAHDSLLQAFVLRAAI
jgi:hypothetical protein